MIRIAPDPVFIDTVSTLSDHLSPKLASRLFHFDDLVRSIFVICHKGLHRFVIHEHDGPFPTRHSPRLEALQYLLGRYELDVVQDGNATTPSKFY